MTYLIGLAGALASLYLFFHAASRIDEDQANIFLVFVGLFLFILFAWDSLSGIYENYYGKEKSKRRNRK